MLNRRVFLFAGAGAGLALAGGPGFGEQIDGWPTQVVKETGVHVN